MIKSVIKSHRNSQYVGKLAYVNIEALMINSLLKFYPETLKELRIHGSIQVQC